jgi:hypothetical protein
MVLKKKEGGLEKISLLPNPLLIKQGTRLLCCHTVMFNMRSE